MRKQYIEAKIYTGVDMWECESKQIYKTDVSVKKHFRESFPYNHVWRQDQLLDKKNQATFLDTYSAISKFQSN